MFTAVAALLLCGSCAASGERLLQVVDADFSGAEQFERWSHFKDHGIPGTTGDDLSRAAIADGACRMLNGRNFGGYALWDNKTLADSVIATLVMHTPSTDRPSHFVHASAAALAAACPSGEVGVKPAAPRFALKPLSAALNAWYRAICAPEDDPSWGGLFDPADQDQQISLTSGFLCIVTCQVHALAISPDAMAYLRTAGLARAAACLSLPWAPGKPHVDFRDATTINELATMTQPLLESHDGGSIPPMCICGGNPTP